MIDPEWAKWGVAGLFCALLLAAAVTDILRRRIPNGIVLGVIALYAVSLALGAAPSAWRSGLAAAAIALLITYALYHFGAFGAGDAKLFSAVALFMGLSNLASFALLTVLIGGLMAVAVIILNPKRALRGLTAAGRAEGAGRGIPYGVAIALGGVCAIVPSLNFAS